MRSVDFGFILQNVELCSFKRIVPKNVLQAFEWHPCQVEVCCCCSPNVVRGGSTSDTRSLDSVSKYPAQVVVVAVVAYESGKPKRDSCPLIPQVTRASATQFALD